MRLHETTVRNSFSRFFLSQINRSLATDEHFFLFFANYLLNLTLKKRNNNAETQNQHSDIFFHNYSGHRKNLEYEDDIEAILFTFDERQN